MPSKFPYMSTPGLIPKILTKIEEAKRPDRFTQDFLETKLGHSGGSARAFIPLLKKMGFLGADGAPTILYDKFRNPDTRSTALASAVKNAYSEIFSRNEYAYNLSREKLTALINEMTGSEKDSRTTQLTVSTFFILKENADFDSKEEDTTKKDEQPELKTSTYIQLNTRENEKIIDGDGEFRMQIGYTININLPETTNVDVFNAIFKALKENLLRQK